MKSFFRSTTVVSKKPLAALAAVGIAAMALVGCSASDDDSTTETTETTETAVNEEARALLPDSIRDRGTLELVSDFAYPPFAHFDGDDFAGLDYEVGSAIAEALGLTPNWTQSIGFSTLIPAVESGRADAALESIGINADRLEVVSMVQYIAVTDFMVVAAGNPKNIDVSDICGTHLATQTGSFEAVALEELSQDCVAAGREPIEQSFFPDNKQALLAVANGRLDGLSEGQPSAEWDAEASEGTLEVLDGPIMNVEGTEPYLSISAGIAVANTEDGQALGEAITLALAGLQEDGTFAKILGNWGVADAALPAKFFNDPSMVG